MSKCGVALTSFAGLLVAVLALSSADQAFAQGGKKAQKGQKGDSAELKKILKKLDPEIRAAQEALNRANKELEKAKSKLRKALVDDALKEKGKTQGKVIDRLKSSVAHTDKALSQVNAAIKAAKSAQSVDKGGN